MQEEFVRKCKLAAKKIAAVAVGAGMVGATVAGAAFAADLSGMPAPFVSDGVFDATVVVGSSAATITAETIKDVAGAIEVATAMGQVATTSATSAGTATLSIKEWSGPSASANINAGSASPMLEVGRNTNYDILGNKTFTLTNDAGTFYACQNLTVGGFYVTNDLNLWINKSSLSNVSSGISYFFFVMNKTSATSNTYSQIDLSQNTTGMKLNIFGTLFAITGWNTSGNVTLGDVETVTNLVVPGEVTVGSHTIKVTDAYDTDNKIDVEIDGEAFTAISSKTYNDVTVDNIDVLKSSTGEYKVTFDVTASTLTLRHGKALPSEMSDYLDDYQYYYADTSNKYGLRFYNYGKAYLVGSSTGDTIYGPGKTANITYKSADKVVGNFEEFSINESSMSTYTLYMNKSGYIEILSSTVPGQTYANVTAAGVKLGDWSIPSMNLALNASSYMKISEAGGKYFLINFTVSNTTMGDTEKPNDATISWVQYYNDTSLQLQSGTEYYFADSGLNVTFTDDANATHDTIVFEVPGLSISSNKTAQSPLNLRYGVSGVYYGGSEYTNLSDYGMRIEYAGSTTLKFIEPDDNEITITLYKNASTGAISFDGISVSNETVTSYGSEIIYNNVTDDKDYLITDSNGWVRIVIPQKKVTYGIGAYTYTDVTLSAGEETTVGNTTIRLTEAAGESVTVNEVTPGFTSLDSDVDTESVTKPLFLVGGPSINSLVKTLFDAGSITDLSTYGAGHAQVEFVEGAFNEQTALVIAGYTADDTLMASRAVAGALLSQSPFNFADYAKTSLILSTGVTVVGDVTITEEATTEETTEETTETTEETTE